MTDIESNMEHSTIGSTAIFSRVIDAHWASVGDNLKVRRALPDAAKKSLGPWVFLDHFGPDAD